MVSKRTYWWLVPCHRAVGTPHSNGYVWRDGHNMAHRAMWQDVYGKIPTGKTVNHYCDNRACDEPLHLWLGTQKENLADMRRKGRDVPRGTDRQPRGPKPAQREAQFTSRMRECECGLKTNAGSMKRHHDKSGHRMMNDG